MIFDIIETNNFISVDGRWLKEELPDIHKKLITIARNEKNISEEVLFSWENNYPYLNIEIEFSTKNEIYFTPYVFYSEPEGGPWIKEDSSRFDDKILNYFESELYLKIYQGGYTPIYDILTSSEADERWDLPKGTVKLDCNRGKFYPHEYRKSGGTWLVTVSAMERVYDSNFKAKDLLRRMEANQYSGRTARGNQRTIKRMENLRERK